MIKSFDDGFDDVVGNPKVKLIIDFNLNCSSGIESLTVKTQIKIKVMSNSRAGSFSCLQKFHLPVSSTTWLIFFVFLTKGFKISFVLYVLYCLYCLHCFVLYVFFHMFIKNVLYISCWWTRTALRYNSSLSVKKNVLHWKKMLEG